MQLIPFPERGLQRMHGFDAIEHLREEVKHLIRRHRFAHALSQAAIVSRHYMELPLNRHPVCKAVISNRKGSCAYG